MEDGEQSKYCESVKKSGNDPLSHLGNSSAVTFPDANTFLIWAISSAWLSLLSSSEALVFILVWISLDTGLLCASEQLLHYRPDGPLPDDLLAGVDLAEDADDGAAGVASDERHDAVLDDGDLLLVLRLQQLHQHVHDLGQVLGVLVLAQGGQVLDGLQ